MTDEIAQDNQTLDKHLSQIRDAILKIIESCNFYL
jgi:hypothetical protein